MLETERLSSLAPIVYGIGLPFSLPLLWLCPSLSLSLSLSVCLSLWLCPSLSLSVSLSLSLCVSVFHHVNRARCQPTTQVPLSIFYTEIPSPQASWRLQGKINKKLISPSSPQHPRKHNSNFQKYESAYSEGRT